MTNKKDFSHLKYYVKRLKEMGFRDVGTNDVDECPDVRLQKQTEEHEYYVKIVDYSGDYKYEYPYMTLSCFLYQDFHAYVRYIYKIGFDVNFEEKIKTVHAKLGNIINEYPTWRSAFNQLVSDYHDLETNTQRGFLISK